MSHEHRDDPTDEHQRGDHHMIMVTVDTFDAGRR
jgi:hypothetical protein